MIVTVPHETNELIEGQVLVDQVHVTSGVAFCVVPKPKFGTGRPTSSWTPAVVRDGKTLFRVQSLVRGDYNVWGQCIRGDETAVVLCGVVSVS